ncbi:ABC transporter ATP-binding protein [Chitinasiproducens palmae]|uniref:Amino acid/amide ABC transporter ATP-binding protein 2, HAAT family n=1 Tax=Chitinasiproducens palmae TaxID=1770053 RepID=A0A1H2PVJ9_9BURK|nr:ABC transporter ATP-binding protein [Chitinasiproducens palmae]SDV51314.1 amino acid/amide ABC transporter ATP-binding protein 2, HAAT family [Chitinasiproducens palmae]
MTRLLAVRNVEASYGASQALFGIDFDVDEGQFVTLLGRNGMGKSTTVKTLTGLLRPTRGTIVLDGQPVHARASHVVARAGVGLVPEGRHVFPTLTVRENLVATAHNRQRSTTPWTLERVYRFFPRLRERERNLAANLSGGEQQMLAIGRALMTNPRLLILDEATEGLAPLIREEIWRCLAELKQTGLAIICIDKHLAPQLALADRHYVLAKGRVAWRGTSAELRAQAERLRSHLSI